MRETRKLLLENNYRSHRPSFQRKIAQLHVEARLGWESVLGNCLMSLYYLSSSKESSLPLYLVLVNNPKSNISFVFKEFIPSSLCGVKGLYSRFCAIEEKFPIFSR